MSLTAATLHPALRTAIDQLTLHPKAVLDYVIGAGATGALMTALIEKVPNDDAGVKNLTFIGPRFLQHSIAQTTARIPTGAAVLLESLSFEELTRLLEDEAPRPYIAVNFEHTYRRAHQGALVRAIQGAEVAYVFGAPIARDTELGQLLETLPQVMLGPRR